MYKTVQNTKMSDAVEIDLAEMPSPEKTTSSETTIKDVKMEMEDSMETDEMDGENNTWDNSKEDSESDEPEAMPELGPAALGLQRVGTKPRAKKPTQPIQALNRRGMPQRIRKKNKLFFDDIMVNHPHHRVKKETSDLKLTPRKMLKPSPVKRLQRNQDQRIRMSSAKSSAPSTPVKINREYLEQLRPSSPDRKIGQKIGMRLRNLLKLPKAHKWVCYEWFYSNLDKTLFEGDNDFITYLNESFPQLKSRKLTRVEWCKMRQMMGKPRRCSQAFFEEERRELERKRQKIRMLQQRKISDSANLKDLPSEIPLQLVIGTKVTARLRKPQDGLFTGSIDAVDTSNNTYRITFDRPGLGTHSVPDYEVLSNEPPETTSLASLSTKFRPRNVQYVPSPPYRHKLQSPRLNNDPLISNTSVAPSKIKSTGNLNGIPVRLLELMVRSEKVIDLKKKKIQTLRNLNTEVEKNSTVGECLPQDGLRSYAECIVELSKLNDTLNKNLLEIQEISQEVAPEPSVAAMLAPSHLREKCKQEAAEMVGKNEMINDKEPSKMNNLVVDLTALLLQVKSLSDSDQNAYELKVLQGTMEQIRTKINGANQDVFRNFVEVPMQQIQLGLGQIGPLTQFMSQKS